MLFMTVVGSLRIPLISHNIGFAFFSHGSCFWNLKMYLHPSCPASPFCNFFFKTAGLPAAK